MNSININRHVITEFTVITLHFTETLSKELVLGLIIQKLYIVKGLKTRMLIRIYILKLECIDIMFSRQIIKLKGCVNMTIIIIIEYYLRFNIS